jgi:hypothetical protein
MNETVGTVNGVGDSADGILEQGDNIGSEVLL